MFLLFLNLKTMSKVTLVNYTWRSYIKWALLVKFCNVTCITLLSLNLVTLVFSLTFTFVYFQVFQSLICTPPKTY